MNKLSNRKLRVLLAILGGTILVALVSINIGYMFFFSWEHSQEVNSKPRGADSKISVQVSDIRTDPDGNINIELSLQVKELLEFIEGAPNKNGEATNNPLPRDVSLLIDTPDLCKQSRDLQYIIYVHTSPKNVEKRQLLRDTWANTELFKERLFERIFLMGKDDDSDVQAAVEAESQKYNDIVQGDFHDNYKNLTLKGLMGLRWVSKSCPQAKYAIKADDDAFVNIFQLVRFLEASWHKENVMACPLWADNSMPILRDPAKCAKWCVRFNEFPGRRYFPQYCAGLTFILSRHLVTAMYEASKETPFFWIDDVYITGLLVSKVKDVQFVKLNQNFTLKHDEALENLLDFKKPFHRLMVHAKDIDQFRPMWGALLARLTADDLKNLSTDAIERNPVLKAKLNPTPASAR